MPPPLSKISRYDYLGVVSIKQARFIVLSWVLSAVAFFAVSFVHHRASGGPGAVIRYFTLVASLCASLILSACFMKDWVALTFVPVIGTPLLGFASFFTAPSVGYGGQIVVFAAKTTLLATLLSMGLVVLAHRFRARSAALARALPLAQLSVVLAGLVFSRGLALMPSVQHRADRVVVRCVRLGSAGLSYPLVEGTSAFLMDAGFLYQVNLEAASVVTKVKLPIPDPAEAGYPDFVNPPGKKSAEPRLGRIARLGPSMLALRYPFNMGRSFKDDSGQGWASAGSWHLEAEVDLEAKKVASWRVVEGPTDFQLGYPHPVQVGPFKVVWGDYKDSLHVTGPRVDTRIWTAGWVEWLVAFEGYALAGTDRGALYVIAFPPPGLTR